MSIVLQRIEAYRQEQFGNLKDHYATLKGGQQPHTLVITCADSRVCPQEFSQSQAGELFVIRNAGNLLPPYDPNSPSNEGLTLEYGVVALGIKEVLICGHASCGAMAGLASLGDLGSLPLVQKGLSQYCDQHKDQITNCSSLEKLISWNVDQQLRNLVSYPFVAEKLKAGEINLTGIVYDFTTAEVTYSASVQKNGDISNEA